MKQRQYACIDLKSFYASVECVERKLDPMKTNLVVADKSRTEKTICLAVSPALKEYKIPGRARLFEVVQSVRQINMLRKRKINGFEGKSYDSAELKSNPKLELDYIIAPPRMELYMKYSTDIYKIYLKYIAPEDIHVYSIDEVFIDITDYINMYKKTAGELVMTIIKDILSTTGITAAAGIGTNMYLAKIAMDIVAKHVEPDKNGVRIAELDEMGYRQKLWEHRPLSDFWRIGKGYAKKLEENGMYTMGDIALCSVGGSNDFYNEELLYKLFGINAELLIDHAWGWEPCRIADIKAYKPENNSISMGQVLHCPYDFKGAGLIVKEMLDLLSLELVDKGIVTNQIVITIGYDIENLTNADIRKKYSGEVKIDRYGRKVPKHALGTQNLDCRTSSTKIITDAGMALFEKITDKNLLIRRINIAANHVVSSKDIKQKNFEQLDLFTDYDKAAHELEKEKKKLEKEKKIQKTILDIKRQYGKNAVVKGMNLEKGATAMERNKQIGGHKA